MTKMNLVLIYLLLVIVGLSIGYFFFIPIVDNIVLGLTIGFAIGGGLGTLIVQQLEKNG